MSDEHPYSEECQCAPCYLERESRLRQSSLAASAGSALTRDQWLARCAAHFGKVAGCDESLAMDLAESQLEILKDDLSENPEQAAEDEISYWSAD